MPDPTSRPAPCFDHRGLSMNHFLSIARLFCRLTLVTLLISATSNITFAQPGKDKDPLSFDRNIGGLLNRYCYRCHRGDAPRGAIDLAQDENPSLMLAHHHTWRTALDQLESGDMPPESARQPTTEERDLMVEFLRLLLDKLNCENSREPGKSILRRLNRVEYDLTVQHLTGLNLRLSENFPPDPLGYGFDNIGEVLQLSPVQVEMYLEAAREVVSQLTKHKDQNPEAYEQVFFKQPEANEPEDSVARLLISDFASKAFRRPVTPEYVDRLMTVYAKSRGHNLDHETAVGNMILAVLISPRFLSRAEQIQPDAEGPYLVDDYDLASRLSYFLWSSPPDQELLDLAGKAALNEPEMLRLQVQRMLKDERSERFAENFFGQWLGLRQLDHQQPDRTAFPDFDDALKQDFKSEVNLLISEIIQADHSLLNLIDSDFTYVNQRLADFYGLPNAEGTEMRRVKLHDRRRGGVLTTAAILMLQSDPTRTNVPRRGNFLAGTLLGDAPPPPPPNVPQLEDSLDGDQPQTLRQALEAHRANPQCATCHDKIDPLGFAFENYDAIGRWRDLEGELAIDASGTLPEGQSFNGPEELKTLLLHRRRDFLRTLTEHMLIYALGRGLIPSDECVVRNALTAGAENGDRCSAIVTAIVLSYPFRYRKNPE
jgi:hypothetical protein